MPLWCVTSLWRACEPFESSPYGDRAGGSNLAGYLAAVRGDASAIFGQWRVLTVLQFPVWWAYAATLLRA